MTMALLFWLCGFVFFIGYELGHRVANDEPPCDWRYDAIYVGNLVAWLVLVLVATIEHLAEWLADAER